MAGSGRKRIEFDMRGQVCPSTLLTALKEIGEHSGALQSGEVSLVFLTDNRDATATIPESASNMGYAAEVRREKSFYVVEVGKVEDGGFL